MRIVIPGDPIATARHRCRCLGKHPSVYDPQFDIKKMLKVELAGIVQGLLYHGRISQTDLDAHWKLPIRLTLTFLMPINLSDSKAVKSLKAWGIILPNVKPDYDNLAKHPGDLGNGILWHDDSQIVEAHIYEKYSENPCTILEIEAIKINMNDEADLMVRLFSPSALEELESHMRLLCSEMETVRLRLGNGEHGIAEKESLAGHMIEFAETYGHALKKLSGKK